VMGEGQLSQEPVGLWPGGGDAIEAVDIPQAVQAVDNH
jgi:hypothetical protein